MTNDKPKLTLRAQIYALRHKYFTFNNLVMVVAFLIAAGWVWGSLQAMQRNYSLQKEVDHKRRLLQLTELQKESLELQKRYYQTNEYKELAARESLGLVMPGERVLILPKNSEAVLEADKAATKATNTPVQLTPESSNLEQWLNFLFGGYSKSIQAGDEQLDKAKS